MMSKQKKSRPVGPISNDDAEIIKKCIMNGWEDRDIAEKINRQIPTIRKYIEKHNLRHQGAGVEPDDAIRLLETLRSRSYYKDILLMYAGNDLVCFETRWIEIMLQFNEDVLPTEESSLIRFLHTEIALNHNRIKNYQANKNLEELQTKLKKEAAAPLEIRDTNTIIDLTTQIDIASSTLSSYNTEFIKLSNEEKSILQELKGSRDVRIKKVEDSKTTFASLIRAMSDERFVKQAGRDAELMKLAMEKKMKELGGYHTYNNAALDRPFLTSDTINMDTNNNEDNKDIPKKDINNE